MDIYQKAEEQIIDKQKIVDFDIKEFTIELLISKYLTGKENDFLERFGFLVLNHFVRTG